MEVYAFKNKDIESILKSASGGAGDVAVQVILKQKGIVYGAAYDGEFLVKHIEVTNISDKERLQSSKYVQSDTSYSYTEVRNRLVDGKKVLFTGTPCQIDGLYAFLDKEYENLYTIDLICHGVPSPKLLQSYLTDQEKKMREKIIYFNFRSKDKRGWGTQYLLKTKTKTKSKTLLLDKYGKHFMEGDCYRECCYQCRYSNTNRVGDLTIGDFWGIEKSYPDFFSSKGVSSVFVNTQKGRILFDAMRLNGEVIVTTLEEAMVKQGNLVKPTQRPKSRDTFYIGIEGVMFFDNIKVGLQLKERIKAALPPTMVRKLKRYFIT